MNQLPSSGEVLSLQGQFFIIILRNRDSNLRTFCLATASPVHQTLDPSRLWQNNNNYKQLSL
jgi:hypothetical protein